MSGADLVRHSADVSKIVELYKIVLKDVPALHEYLVDIIRGEKIEPPIKDEPPKRAKRTKKKRATTPPPDPPKTEPEI